MTRALTDANIKYIYTKNIDPPENQNGVLDEMVHGYILLDIQGIHILLIEI